MEIPEDQPLIRTGPADNWPALVDAATAESAEGFRARLHLVDNARFEGADPSRLFAEFPDAEVLFVADDRALTEDGFPILCLDPETGQQARCRAKDLWVVENNISVGNMLFGQIFDVPNVENGIYDLY